MRLASVLVSAIAVLVWQFTPLQAVVALSSLTDPVKLSTLGERGANPRVNKAVYWLHVAETRNLAPSSAVDWINTLNGVHEPRASLVKSALLKNLKTAEELGLFTGDNPDRLRRGNAGIVAAGPYEGETVEIDHIVPVSLAPEIGNELANLEMLPKTLNRRKSDRVGERQLAHAQKLFDAGLLSPESLEKIKAKARSSEH